jgi:hypothetical protein
MSRMNVLSMLFVQLNVQKLKEALRIIVPHHFRSPSTTQYFYDLLTFLFRNHIWRFSASTKMQ